MTLKVPGAAGAVCVEPVGTTSESVKVPGVSPRKEKLPEESVVVVRTFPAASRSWIVTPASPPSPVSRTPLPLTSLNFVPEIVAGAARFPKRRPETVWCPKSRVAVRVPGGGGAVCA